MPTQDPVFSRCHVMLAHDVTRDRDRLGPDQRISSVSVVNLKHTDYAAGTATIRRLLPTLPVCLGGIRQIRSSAGCKNILRQSAGKILADQFASNQSFDRSGSANS